MTSCWRLVVFVSVAACTGANADLADLENLAVRVTGGQATAGGVESLHISLEYDGVVGSVPHGCAVLGFVDVEVNGAEVDDKSYGEWRDTSLAGSAPYCEMPEFRIRRPQLSDDESALITLDDGSREIALELPRLRAPRSIGFVNQAPLEPGVRVELATILAPGDRLARGRATADFDDGDCTRWPLLDFGLDPEVDGYSFEVPDWIELQDQSYTFTCGAPLVEGEPRQADVALVVGVTPEQRRCDGADLCEVTWSTGVSVAATIVP